MNKKANSQNQYGDLNSVFIPASPIVDKEQCYGRYHEIKYITSALQDPGRHVILFGGRGYGKTSIANIVSQNLKNFYIVKMNCNRSQETFSTIWRDVLKKIKSGYDFSQKNKNLTSFLEKCLDDIDEVSQRDEIEVVDVVNIFKKINIPFLVILDEADLISKNVKNRSQFSDLIKTLSDEIPTVKLMIIGIAENSNDLIGEHSSLERCILEIKIDKMTNHDLQDILEGGLIKIDMNMTPEVKKNIILFSCGLPYYIHLLSFYSAQDAIELSYKTIIEKNFCNAVMRAIQDMNENLKSLLKKALGRSKDNSYLDILEMAVCLEEKAIKEQHDIHHNDPDYQCDYSQVAFSVLDVLSLFNKKRSGHLDGKKLLEF